MRRLRTGKPSAYCAAEAKLRRVTKSRLVRDSLEKALSKPSRSAAPSCYDLARDLAGSVKGLPEDLTENPKYMDGFRIYRRHVNRVIPVLMPD